MDVGSPVPTGDCPQLLPSLAMGWPTGLVRLTCFSLSSVPQALPGVFSPRHMGSLKIDIFLTQSSLPCLSLLTSAPSHGQEHPIKIKVSSLFSSQTPSSVLAVGPYPLLLRWLLPQWSRYLHWRCCLVHIEGGPRSSHLAEPALPSLSPNM